MKPLMSLNSITTENYKLFYAYPKPYDFTLHTYSGQNYVPLTEDAYDVFDGGDSVVICFKQPPVEVSPYVAYIERDGVRHAVEFEYFSNIQELFGRVPPRSSYLYWIMDSVIVTEKFTKDVYSAVSLKDRCDSYAPTYGPWRFEPSDGVKPTSYDYEAIPQSSWFGLNRIISEPGSGHILRMTLVGEIEDWVNWPLTSVAATSLIEAIQLSRHWAMTTEEPWNSSERIAAMSKKFVNELDFDLNLKDELDSACSETVVSRYLKGDEESRKRDSLSCVIGENLSAYMLERICHSSLSSLAKHSLFDVQIPSEILKDDKKKVDSELFNFLIKNEIDFEGETPLALLVELREKVDSKNFSNVDRQYERVLHNYIATLDSVS